MTMREAGQDTAARRSDGAAAPRTTQPRSVPLLRARLQLSTEGAGVHRLHTRASNWYLIEDRGRLTVLDAGLPGQWGDFLLALERLGHAPSDIEAVVITHHHPDHAGNAEALRRLGVRAFAHPADMAYLRGEQHLPRRQHLPYLRRSWYRRYLLHLLLNGVTRVPPIASLEAMDDGEVLDVPGSPRVVHVPGHTAGSCALLLERRSVLFTGDALTTLDCTEGRTGPTIVRGPVTEDAGLAVRSLEALERTGARLVLPGHGEPWRDGVRRAVELARAT